MSFSLAQRRQLSRALSRVVEATVETTLGELARPSTGSAWRVGITGSPGAGKSSLISQYAKRRLDQGLRAGILAIDPSSPVTGGSLLGDRIRLDAVADDPRLFIRSLPSRAAHDGLCDNAPDLLATMDAFAFDEIILETVGVGQAEYAVRSLVDTLVLVLVPGSGDAIQAMKAGILERADIYVINKADLTGAEKIRAEIMLVLGCRKPDANGWEPKLVMVSATKGSGVDDLVTAIDGHQTLLRSMLDADQVRRQRRAYHLRSLIARRLDEVMQALPETVLDAPLSRAFEIIATSIIDDGNKGIDDRNKGEIHRSKALGSGS